MPYILYPTITFFVCCLYFFHIPDDCINRWLMINFSIISIKLNYLDFGEVEDSYFTG